MGGSNYGPDQRVFPRFDYLECAVVHIPGEESIQAMMVDIGLGGVQLRSKKPLPVGTPLTISIGKDKGGPINMPGILRHCTLSTEGEHIYIAGFKFTPQTHEERAVIAKFVHEVFTRYWNSVA